MTDERTTQWFYVSLNGGFVAIEARDEAHATRRAEKGGYTVKAIQPLGSTSQLWLSVAKSFPLPATPTVRER
jgi:hypothetical protein